MIGDGEAAARNVLAVELPIARLAGERIERGACLFEAERSDVAHDGDHEALVAKRGADPDVDGRRNRDAVFLPATVDRGRNRHRVGRGLEDVGGVAELLALRLHRCLVRGDGGEIAFEQRRDMRRVGDRADHIVRDRAAHAVVRNVGGAEWRGGDGDGRAVSEHPLHVFQRDAAALPRPVDFRGVDIVLQHRAFDRRREARFLEDGRLRFRGGRRLRCVIDLRRFG